MVLEVCLSHFDSFNGGGGLNKTYDGCKTTCMKRSTYT
jgi:hypothetical protein